MNRKSEIGNRTSNITNRRSKIKNHKSNIENRFQKVGFYGGGETGELGEGEGGLSGGGSCSRRSSTGIAVVCRGREFPAQSYSSL